MINFIAFQIVWFSCVLGASWGNTWLPVLATLVFVLLHFSISPVRRADAQLLALAIPIGIFLATLWSLLGILQYSNQPLFPVAPLWIVCLWVAFALTLNHSLSWMQRNLYLAGLLAAVGSPLSYYGAQKLGAVVWLDSTGVIAATSLSWLLVVPLLLRKAAKWSQEGRHALA
ncbi:DUF2878 domain-containing protein [Porticoccus sp. W117]|uniref:DUF2878 domain-containing protein n=1 Tax=Porticoccus sp. W117 TaxID=3054777 RepID=UPI00259559ED|nr:DUF2878 domain-containing protein [Porticoccus sp. W117]MDM3869964.1 DUF2878 domain-containing protein [Porticoccus sp. W117]